MHLHPHLFHDGLHQHKTQLLLHCTSQADKAEEKKAEAKKADTGSEGKKVISKPKDQEGEAPLQLKPSPARGIVDIPDLLVPGQEDSCLSVIKPVGGDKNSDLSRRKMPRYLPAKDAT